MPDDDRPNDVPLPLDTGYSTPSPAALEHAFKIAFEAKPPKSRTGRRVTVCALSELPPGQRRIVEAAELSIGVFNVGGTLYAVKNVCPHYGAPLCQGSLHATHAPSDVGEFDPALEGRVLRCPWHGWEFDLASGKGLYDRNSRVATYAVEVDERGDVVVVL